MQLIPPADSATRDRLCLASAVILIAWFCQDIILSDKAPFFRDLSTYFYPLRYSLQESYRSGSLPLWNRHIAMGFPVLADFQSGAFYPPHLAFFVFPFFAAVRVLFVGHFLIAATGAYKLFRHWDYPCYLALLGALLFTLGGTVVSLTNLLNHFETGVWLPWVIFFWERVVRSVSWRRFLAFVLVLCVQLLAGSPELFALTTGLVVADALRIKASEPELSYGRMAFIFVCASLLVAAVTMVQLLPTLELLRESRRQQPIPFHEAVNWSLRPVTLLNLFFFDKEVDFTASLGIRHFFTRATPFFVSYYLGAISLFGICLWLYLSSLREKIAVIGLVLGSLLVAMGSYTPVYSFLFHHFPIFSAVRFPEKFFFFTYALLVYIIMRGLAAFLVGNCGRSKHALLVLSAICAAWIGAYLYLRSNVSLIGRLITENAAIPPSSAVHPKLTAALLANLERQMILSLGFFLLFALIRTGKIRRSLFAFLLVATAFVDLAWTHRDMLFPLNPELVYKGPRIMREPDPDPKRFFYYPPGRNLHPSYYAVQGRPLFKDAVALFYQNLLPNNGILYGFDYFQEIDALARRPYTDFLKFANGLDTAIQLRLLRIFNVGYVVFFKPLSADGITLVAEFPQYFSWLYKIDQAVPRVYVVGMFVVEKDGEQTLKRLAAPNFDPTQEVILDQDVGIKPHRATIGRAAIMRYEHQAVTVRVSLNDSGILVFTDAYYPGWKAYVGGVEVPIVKANYFFRAVTLSRGQHLVEFRYEPQSFKTGLWISAFTLVALVAVTLLVSVKGDKPPPTTETKAPQEI